MLHRIAALICAALALAGCGRPDSQVFGGVIGDQNTPNAVINDVGSAVAGIVSIADQNGTPHSYTAVILTDRHNLCTSLAARPDYFKSPPEAGVALILLAKADQLGTFLIGASNGAQASLNTTAGPGNPIARYPAVQGSVSMRQFDKNPNGEGDGTFDVIIVDSGGVGHEVYGKFKTATCAALANAQF